MRNLHASISKAAIPSLVALGLVAAGIIYGAGLPYAQIVLLMTLVIGALPLFYEVFTSMLRGKFGVDLIAIVAIASSLLLEQYLAGTVILLMLSGGEALEEFALKRARKELTELFARVPRIAHRKIGESILDVPVESIRIGEEVIIKPGETVPVDGEVTSGEAMMDGSALTGEVLPVRKFPGQTVMSGMICSDAVLTVRALRPSNESTYANIIRLVQESEQKKAPFVRLADRYSVVFTSITFVLAVIAWLVSHDPLRLLAVLVVATPCPLILATPIAFAAGISTAAKRGIIIRSGQALEKLAEARSLVFDKTGTITLGAPTLREIKSLRSSTVDILSIAASLDRFSAHILARALTAEAMAKKLRMQHVDGFVEKFGEGVRGTINGKVYTLGRLSFLQKCGVAIEAQERTRHESDQEKGILSVYLAEETSLIGVLHFEDVVRPNVQTLFSSLRSMGIRTVRMLTGDRRSVAVQVAASIGLREEDVEADCMPEDKVRSVENLRRIAAPVVMVGDGVNDAPAIAVADVGIAMGAHGDTASSQAGDIVIMIDEVERIGEALCIARAVLRIARESVLVGIGLSIILMVIAAAGFIAPVYGALLQELIDVAVILNALRVLLVRCKVTRS